MINRRSLRTLASAALLGGFSFIAHGQEFDPIFNDGAVLQCEMAANVWGSAPPDAAVIIHLDGQKLATATADASGKWLVALSAQPLGGPHVLEATVGSQSAKISEVWFGEVWLATGQSNMAATLENSHGGKEALAKTLPEIRFVKVPKKYGLPVEASYTSTDLKWKTFAPGPNREIAAVAFYFAEKLQPALGRKVGIIQSSHGGTPAQAWTPLWALEGEPELKHYADIVHRSQQDPRSKEEWLKDANAMQHWVADMAAWKKTRVGPQPPHPGRPDPGNPWSPKTPTVLYENMISPLVPYTARGIIWYQGEANTANPKEYEKLFPAMIAAWRKTWNRPDWPFLFVQLASYGAPGDWPGLRAAQTLTRDTVPHTGMALAIDVGEEKDIHPKAKQPVGDRLARLALHQVYGKDVPDRGPMVEKLNVSDGAVTVSFQHTGNGLQTSDGARTVPGFEVAGTDGKFHPAEARIVSDSTIELKAEAIEQPARVRYAWRSWVEPPVTLQNSDGLPAEPFQMEIGGAIGG